MKFHLPCRLFKLLMAVVCVPGTTIAVDLDTQGLRYLYKGGQELNAGVALTEAPASMQWNSKGNDSSVWNTEQNAVWIDESTREQVGYKAGSDAEFGKDADLNKNVQIAPEHVEASSVEISGSGYHFSGGDMIVTDRLSVAESASIDSALIIGSTTTPLTIDIANGKTFTTGKLGTSLTEVNGAHIHAHGAFIKTGGGTLSVTDDVHGLFSAATIQSGELVLGDGVALEVGANEFLGGTLKNVDMHLSADIYRPVSDGMVTAHNLIRSADGVNAAVLTDVALHAGTATEYATLKNVVFAGNGSLTGFITYEKTQAQREMGVATDGTLAVKNVTFDLHGLSSGEKVLIENKEVSDAAEHLKGELTGWDTVKFVYSGIAVNSAAVNSAKAGMVTINRVHNGNLYWTGAADDKWNPSSANWSLAAGENGEAVFTALSNVYFGSDNVEHKNVIISQDVVAMNLSVTGGGYSFSGARVATLGDALISPTAGKVTFNDQLVVQGSLTTSGEGTVELLGATTVVKNMTLNSAHTTLAGDVTVLGTGDETELGKFTVNAGTETTAGSLDISGNVTAKEMDIAVRAGANGGASYNDALVNVTGDLSVGDSGNITIGGTAEQHYLGVVRAGNLTVNTLEHEVFFDHLHVGRLTEDGLTVGGLTVGKGAHVHVQTSSAAVAISSSTIPNIYLSGTLALDAHDTTYDRGYKVYVQDDAAVLSFGTGCTIGNMEIYGKEDGSGYTDLEIEAQSRSATVEHMEGLGNLSVRMGAVTVKDATGAVHGALLLDNGKLNLAEKTDNFMAAGSGEIKLVNASRLNIGSTTQNLSADNKLSLYGSSSITGDASGRLVFADGTGISYKDKDNAIKANLLVNNALKISSEQKGSSLDIAGQLSGNGSVELSGAGTVAFSDANSFSGFVTVGKDSTLSLQDAVTLSQAGVILNNGGTLALDTDTAVKLNKLEFNDGSTLAFSTVTGTEEFSALNAALHVSNGATFDNSGTLNIVFSETLKTLTTYNLLTGLTSSSFDNLTLNVTHNGAALDDSQYKVGFDAASGLLYVHTLMGNVWEGKSDYAMKYKYGIWSTSDKNGNWNDGSDYKENVAHHAAIFGDLDDGAVSKVNIIGKVTPKDVYFVAEKTTYELSAMNDDKGAGYLAVGTNIHKDGHAAVTLQLYGNMSAATALGSVDIQAGSLILEDALAVSGTVTIAQDGQLAVKGGSSHGIPIELKMGPNKDGSFNYTASSNASDKSATLSGVTMDAAGIRGMAGAPGSADKLLVQGTADLSYLNLIDFGAKGNVTLSHVTLASSDATQSRYLENVTIGQGVEVLASGNYTLSGKITFEDTLTNHGKVTLTGISNIEIGKMAYSYTVDDNGKVKYDYQLIEGNGELVVQTFESKQVSVNGVNLATGLAAGIVADFNDNENGSFTLSIGNETADGTSDGSVGMLHWDERWGKMGSAPGISRRYVGTDASANVELAAGKDGDTSYYLYNSIVSEDNSLKVNDGKAIAVTLASIAKGELAVGGNIKDEAAIAADHEVWIYDRSELKNIIGGLDNSSAKWADNNPYQSAATHILVDSGFKKDPDSVALGNPIEIKNRENWAKKFIIGGTRWGNQGAQWANQAAESFVTVRNGEIYTIFGASCGGDYLSESWTWKVASNQYGTSHVFVDGGRIGEIFAAGMHSTLIGTQQVNGRPRAVELVLTGGKLGGENLRVFGGGERGVVHGDIYIRMEGNAEIVSRLVGGSNAGKVYGNITLDLISGSAFRVDAAGLGWDNGEGLAYIEGEVLVNLYSAFKLGKGIDLDRHTGIYGGRETDNYVSENCTSTLHFAEGKKYELGRLSDDGYTASDDSIIVTGFDRFTLEDKAHAVLALGYFDIDMDPSRTLEISGNGVVEVIGHSANFGRNIELTNGATLKVSTSVIGKADDATDDRTISVTKGTTLDLTGYPEESDYVASMPYAGLSFNAEICGDGVNGKGAIFKGTTHETDDGNILSVNRVSLPNIKLTGNASVGVMNHEVLHMSGYKLGETTLNLGGYTFTKQGLGSFVARNVKMSEGTLLVHQGDFYIDKGSLSSKTDIVMADGTSLYLNSVQSEDGTLSPAIRSLSGAGSVILNDAELTLYTTSDSAYKGHYMDEEQSYDQFLSTTGFGYGVFSGTITEGSGVGSLSKNGNGVHYISGSANTYSGGTRIYDGRLYLLGTSTQSGFDKGASNVALGVAGTGDIIWAGENAELYLGHDARIYNDGTTNVLGGVMVIGVEGTPHLEGVPNGVLANFVGIHSKGNTPVVRDGVKYVEIETHNLKSIAVDALYADGTKYVKNTDIDRNKMLLVKQSDWETVKNTPVTGFFDAGYNEAIYSGVLRDSNGVAAKLHKVGVGTLVLDQSNSYTGGTEIDAGTLRVRGWGTLGKNEKENAAIVHEYATLMFTHNSGYGNEPTRADNDIIIDGIGDARWVGHAATDGDTAALISAVGPAVTFTLSGDISGSGNVRHSGEGVLVLSGDNSYTGGTYASRGTVEVQSAKGLGATATGQGAVTIEADADLKMTVGDEHTEPSMVTKLASEKNRIEGDVRIEGTDTTERVLHMASNGYQAASTTLTPNAMFLLNGAGVSAHTTVLTGDGSVVVSDATGAGSVVTVGSIIDYTGDFRVEGDNASVNVRTGSYIDGSIHVAGQHASVHIGGGISIADGESLNLRSTGDALAAGGSTAAQVSSDGAVSVAAGAVLSVGNEYDLTGLELEGRLVLADVAPTDSQEVQHNTAFTAVGSDSVKYNGCYDPTIALNQQAAGVIIADGGLTLVGGATYETFNSHVNLMGSGLTLNTMEHSLIEFNTMSAVTFDASSGKDVQLVLFSGVGSVYFDFDGVQADADSGIYYTQANRYLTSFDGMNEDTLLVYDSQSKVVYLHMPAIPEPATGTLGLLALISLAARRRRAK